MRFKTKEDIDNAKALISHPGETLFDTIEAKSISQTELANRMGRPIKTINEIIQGKAAIIPDTAIQLERVLGISAEFWLNREQNYRLELAEIQEAEKILTAKEWLTNFPLNQMKKFGWINYAKNDIIEMYNAVLAFFAVSNIDAFNSYYKIENAGAAYRMSTYGVKSPYSVNAWLRQGEIQASKLKNIQFDSAKFKESLNDIKSLMALHPDNFFSQLQNICLEAGVKVVHTPCLQKTMLFGSTRWLNGIPLIQLSNQYRRNDIFWFTFFHEAGHILEHGKKDVFIEGLEYNPEQLIKEKQADDFAIKYTFSTKEENQLLEEIMEVNDKITYIHEYARKINTHTALIIGRLAKKDIIHDSVGWSLKFYKKVDLTN